jgi:hypothetical protein
MRNSYFTSDWMPGLGLGTRVPNSSLRFGSGGFTTIVRNTTAEDPPAPPKEEEMHESLLEQDIRAALVQHWAASDANDFLTEHEIYCDDAILDYPQSGERIRGRANIQASRTAQPSKKRFEVRRILGSGALWITEFIIYYDEKPFHTVSIMEFRDGKVVHETQYFGEPFAPGASRSRFVEPIGPASPTE